MVLGEVRYGGFAGAAEVFDMGVLVSGGFGAMSWSCAAVGGGTGCGDKGVEGVAGEGVDGDAGVGIEQ